MQKDASFFFSDSQKFGLAESQKSLRGHRAQELARRAPEQPILAFPRHEVQLQ